MAYRQYTLTPLDIGGDLVATDVWISASPIVLVSTHERWNKTTETKSRLDLQKQIFMDPLPGEPSREGIRDLVHSVLDAASNGGRRSPETRWNFGPA